MKCWILTYFTKYRKYIELEEACKSERVKYSIREGVEENCLASYINTTTSLSKYKKEILKLLALYDINNLNIPIHMGKGRDSDCFTTNNGYVFRISYNGLIFPTSHPRINPILERRDFPVPQIKTYTDAYKYMYLEGEIINPVVYNHNLFTVLISEQLDTTTSVSEDELNELKEELLRDGIYWADVDVKNVGRDKNGILKVLDYGDLYFSEDMQVEL